MIHHSQVQLAEQVALLSATVSDLQTKLAKLQDQHDKLFRVVAVLSKNVNNVSEWYK
jgi:cell division protein FtsB